MDNSSEPRQQKSLEHQGLGNHIPTPVFVRQRTERAPGGGLRPEGGCISVKVSDEFRRRAAESFHWARRARSYLGAGAWLTMAQTWLERAQIAERREAAPTGDLLP